MDASHHVSHTRTRYARVRHINRIDAWMCRDKRRIGYTDHIPPPAEAGAPGSFR